MNDFTRTIADIIVIIICALAYIIITFLTSDSWLIKFAALLIGGYVIQWAVNFLVIFISYKQKRIKTTNLAEININEYVKKSKKNMKNE